MISICEKVGTNPPDNLIAGVDDHFFVTEHPLTVSGQKFHGKTLFVSLPLLKQLSCTEADAVLVHEMAHFSGDDTSYSRRISPLLSRYDIYLQGLSNGLILAPIAQFMKCFRVLFELSMSKVRREREFRADRIAAEMTSPRDVATSLLRLSAYSKFRRTVEQELFREQEVLQSADVSGRLEREFTAYAGQFVNDGELHELRTTHPFDSHPPVMERLAAVQVDLNVEDRRKLFATASDGGWFHRIEKAIELERELWKNYESRFAETHRQSLPYRLRPDNLEQQAIVEVAFPPLTFETKVGPLLLDFEKIHYPKWPDAIYLREVVTYELRSEVTLKFLFQRGFERDRDIEMKQLEKPTQEAFLCALQHYLDRCRTAIEYQKQLQGERNSGGAPS